MGDVLDILELDRPHGVSGEKKVLKKKRPPEQTFKKPEGMTREVYALLYSDQNDNSPLIPSDFAISSKLGSEFGYKKAKANLSLRKVRKWSWMPFTNPARKDGFRLYHWRREVDRNKEYPFVKMNVTVNVPTYTDLEYKELLQSDSWTKAETDYLMKMCKKHDLRFIVIEDRWDRDTYGHRTVEDIKDRYYFVCNALDNRNDSNYLKTKQPLYVFDPEHERKRKEQLIALYNRTPEEVEEEQRLLAVMRKIDQRKKEREKKTQDLQKMFNQSEPSSEPRRNEQQVQARANASMSRSSRKKTQGKSGNLELAGIRFVESRASGVSLNTARMKLPSTVGQKKAKAIKQMLDKLGIEHGQPLGFNEVIVAFNELRSDMVLLYQLNATLEEMEFELASLKAQVSAAEQAACNDIDPVQTTIGTQPVTSTPISANTNTDLVSGSQSSTISSTPVAESKKDIKEETSTSRMPESSETTPIVAPRKRKAAMEHENFMRKLRKN